MSTGSYRFKLGAFDCVSLSDGSFDYPPENFFADVPLERIEQELRRLDLPTDHITTPYTYLYVDTGEHQVLVDAGAGDLGPRTGNLLESMQGASVQPGEIDTVVITHGHPDHVGGMLDGVGRPVFSNAQHYISKDEWEFWFTDTASKMAPEVFVAIARTNLAPVQDQVRLVNRESEVVPGVRAIPAPGHTPGHIVVQVRSGDERLYYIGDAVLYPLHLEHPDWTPIYDILPEQAEATKHAVFDRAADEEAWVIGQHFPPFPSLGHVVRQQVGWEWRPIDMAV